MRKGCPDDLAIDACAELPTPYDQPAAEPLQYPETTRASRSLATRFGRSADALSHSCRRSCSGYSSNQQFWDLSASPPRNG